MPESINPIIRAAYLRELALKYAWCWIKTPYKYGGDDFSSMDCSGFVIEILQGVGVLPVGRDYTANDLWTIFKPAEVARGYAGCLAFWFDDSARATHVMLCIDSDLVLGAAGGGPATATASDAIRDNAFLKMRPLLYRKDKPRIVDPFKTIGDRQ